MTTDHETDIDAFLADARVLAKKHKTNLANVIAAKHALELERANQALPRIVGTLREISESIDTK